MQPALLFSETLQLEYFEKIAADLATHGFSISSNLLPQNWVINLRNFAKKEREEGSFQVAGIGKMHQFNVDKSIRGDTILWVEDDFSNDYIKQIEKFICDLRLYLNRTCFLGLRDHEMHFAVYPKGSFYKRHADRFKLNAHRHISFVFYLNIDWQAEDGGELKIYLQDGTETTVDPTGGTLVVFRSELEHEVLQANVARYSLTGWMLDIEKGITFL